MGDGMAEEERRGAPDSAGEDAGDGVWGSMGGDAEGGFVAGECMGEDGLAVAVGE